MNEIMTGCLSWQNDVMMGDRVVDINVATVEDLETLVGVGRAKAEAIVNTRTVSDIHLVYSV